MSSKDLHELIDDQPVMNECRRPDAPMTDRLDIMR
jgi:hypothetical protein